MIEQTDLVVDEWIYLPPAIVENAEAISSDVSLQVQRKSASTKKGLACRFTCVIQYQSTVILSFIAQDSYVIDLDDVVEADEVRRMIKNSYSKFKEKYNFKRLGTVLQDIELGEYNEQILDVEEIVGFLN